MTTETTERKKRVKLSPLMKNFLEAYRIDPCVTRAAAAAGCARGNHDAWLRSNAKYREAFNDAREEMADGLEREIRRRAVEGIPRYRFTSKGAPVYDPNTDEDDPKLLVERHYSDKLLELLIKRHRPEFNTSTTNLNIGGSLGVDHSGEIISVAKLLEEMHSDPDYVEFLQWKAEQKIPEDPDKAKAEDLV